MNFNVFCPVSVPVQVRIIDWYVSIVGFGAFEAKVRPARKGHNPMTGEVINLNASKAPSFKAGKSLKEILN